MSERGKGSGVQHMLGVTRLRAQRPMEQAGSPEQKVTQGVRGKVAANAKLDLDHEESVTSVTYTFGFNLDHEEPRNVLRVTEDDIMKD